MGEHRDNPFSRAKAAGNQIVRALDLGDNIALTGVQLIPAMDEAKENLVVLLCAVGGRQSPLMPLEPRPAVIGELVKVPLATLRRVLGGGSADAGEESLVGEASEPVSDTTPPRTSPEPEEKPATSGLVLVP